MTASIFMATSLDGFIARPDDALDWLPAGGGKEHGYREFIAAEDAIVMGHRTFEKVLTFGAWPFGKKQVTVLSTKPSGVAVPAGAVCEAMAGTPSEVVTRLSERGLAHLYVDGGVTFQRLLEASLYGREEHGNH